MPLLLMIISDLIIGLHDTIFFTWGSVLLITLIGIRLKGHKSFNTIFAASLSSSLLFFVITNFGAWLRLYPQTLDGLTSCYIAAIPFFRNTLFSTLLYSFILFGLYELVALKVRDTRLARILLSA